MVLETLETYIKGVWDAKDMVICKFLIRKKKGKGFDIIHIKSILKATTHYKF